jgi:hypothetical protein
MTIPYNNGKSFVIECTLGLVRLGIGKLYLSVWINDPKAEKTRPNLSKSVDSPNLPKVVD